MRKLFAYIFIASFILAFFATPGTSLAQPNYFDVPDAGLETAAALETSLAATPTTPAAPPRTEPGGCSLDILTESAGNVFNCGLAHVAQLAMQLTSYLLFVGSAFLNLAMSFTLNLSSYSGSVEAGWKVVRDLINIALIFGLLWIAIRIILNQEENWKRPLTSIVLAALFINFSLFFTKVIIDASNIVALQFYTSITGGKFTPINELSGVFSSMADSGISDHFMDRLNIITLFNTTKTSLTAGNIVLIGLFGSILIIIASAVFFIAGLMLLARTAILLLLMLTSPVGFAGTWLPRLKAYHEMWWKNLVDQSLFAPVFLLLVWGVLKITEVGLFGEMLTPSGTKANFANALTGNVSSMGIIFNFLLMIALILAALKVAKDLSGTAGKSFSSWGQKALGTVAGGVGGFALRNTAGRLASKLASTDAMKNWAATSALGGMTLKGTRYLAGANYDVRGGIPGTGPVSSLLKTAGVDIKTGKPGGKGGYEKTLQDQIKAKTKFAESIKGGEVEIVRKITDRDRLREGAPAEEKIKVDRKQAYAERLKSEGSPETLWLKVARKNKDAAKKIQKEFTDKTELKKLRADKERLRAALRQAGDPAERERVTNELAEVEEKIREKEKTVEKAEKDRDSKPEREERGGGEPSGEKKES
ncbi:MAG: hypothetical protein Q8Q36_02320 [bacterium]|nr:hypothetical protein [bacterium]